MAGTAAIFDVDNTILFGSSGTLFINAMFKKRMMTPWRWMSIGWFSWRYSKGWINDEQIVRRGASCYAGQRIDSLKDAAVAAVSDYIAPRLYKEALSAIQAHQNQGHKIILASGSSNIIVSALADHLNADAAVGTSAKVVNGVSTAEVTTPMCYKQGKLTLVQSALEKMNISIENCYMYSDNYTDLSLFRKVAHPHPVNPGGKLTKEAISNGWDILAWTETADPSYKYKKPTWPI